MRRSTCAPRVSGWLLAAGLLTLILAGIPARAFATGSWIAQSSGTSGQLLAVAFPDTVHGWAVGDAGTIRVTSDAGAHWRAQASGTTADLNAVAFVDPSHGWAVGGTASSNTGIVLATVDGGATWTVRPISGFGAFSGVAFSDVDHGCIVGSGGTILATVDGGSHWTRQASGTSNALSAVAFADTSHGWVVGQHETILGTSDGGANWTLQRQVPSDARGLNAVACADAHRVYAAGHFGLSFFATGDGGKHWGTVASNSGFFMSALAFADDTNGLAVGDYGSIVRTSDGGAHWAKDRPRIKDAPYLYGVACVDAAHAWAVGGDGTILAYRAAAKAAPRAAGTSGLTWAMGAVLTLALVFGAGVLLARDVRRRKAGA